MTDKQLPHAEDLERAILGAILVDSDGYDKAATILKPEHFYNDNHAKIFEVMGRFYANNQKIDILTIPKAIPEIDKFYIIELTSNIASTAHIETHAGVVYQTYASRKLIQAATKSAAEAYQGDIWETLNTLEIDLEQIRMSSSVSECKSIQVSVVEHLNKPQGFQGVTTGFNVINKPTNGWKENNLYVIAARPGMGKTAWVLQSALKAAQEDNPVLIYSIEMGEEQIINRLVSLLSGVEHDKIIKNNITPTEAELLNKGYSDLSELPIHIDYSSVQHAKDFIHKTRIVKRKKGIKAVYVDYLQKMRSDEENKVIEIGTIASTLKITAKDLHIPVIALAQLSREVEKSSSKRPELSHLRESGRIEEEADFAAFLFRSHYYYQQGHDGFKNVTIDDIEFDSENIGEFIIAKNRHGNLGSIYLNFKGNTMKWDDFKHHRIKQEVLSDIF